MKHGLISMAEKHKNEWNHLGNMWCNKTISIVIPVFWPEHLEEVIAHLEFVGGFNEVILVDDSGEKILNKYNFLKDKQFVKIIYHKENFGRSAARNTGAFYANGELLIFLDQDMFMSPQYINTMKKMFYYNNSVVFLGLRYTTMFENIPRGNRWKEPPREFDWRISTTVDSDFIDLTVNNVGNSTNKCFNGEKISIYEKTNRLQNMGVKKEETIGFWDLPSMVVSHSLAISKNDYVNIGGFPEWIEGWGGEDIVLGFLACAKHIPIVLSDCVSYQAMHKPFSGSEQAKIEELKKNIRKYREWTKNIDIFPTWDTNIIKERVLI